MAFRCVRCHAAIEKSFAACPNCGEPVTDFLRRYLEEPIDGKYEILERLGAGGMGEVYKVRHRFLGSMRVIKVIRAQISGSKDAHDRFLREARVATKVQHPNVATLHDFSELPDGSHYMVWEYIEGENLAQRLRSGPISPKDGVRIAIEALHGLEAIHRAGIVHRDISPENLMIAKEEDGSERVKIIDLGVAKSSDPGEEATRTGMFLGKFRYASPEHVGFLEAGEKIDGRADLYSLAIVLYEVLAGRPPFDATSPHEFIILHSRETAFRPLDLPPDLPGGEALQAVLKRALERDRNKRFPTAREFAAALTEVNRTLGTVPAYDGDSTMRLKGGERGTLFGTTERSEMPAPPTTRTPLPEPPPAAPTLRTPLPAPVPDTPAPHPATVPAAPPPRPTARAVIDSAPPRRGSPVVLIMAIVAIVVLAAFLAFVWSRGLRPATPTVTASTPTTAPLTQTQTQPTTTTQLASAQVDVVTDTTPTILTNTTSSSVQLSGPATQTTTTTTTVRPKPRPVPVPAPVTQTEEPAPQPQPEPQPQTSNVKVYVEGADSGDNEAAMSLAQSALAGTTRVAVRGSGDPGQTSRLVNLLKDRFTIDDGADVKIDFFGKLERMGLGRKRRIVNATITRGGRAVFRYQLSQEYRVGDDPAEAFARVLEDVFGH